MTSIIPTVTIAAVWLASYGKSTTLGGFAKSDMIMYFVGSLVITNIISSSISFDMGNEIKQGRLSFYLVRPLSYPVYQFLANLGWRVFRTMMFLPFLPLIWLALYRELNFSATNLGWQFWFAIIIAHLLSFAMSFFVGSWALFLEDMSSIDQIYSLSSFLLSGSIAPIALMPKGLQAIADWSPFRYVLSFPLEILTEHSSMVGLNFVISLSWLILFVSSGLLLFNFGLRRYSAIGQ